jgi:hypothetical protein
MRIGRGHRSRRYVSLNNMFGGACEIAAGNHLEFLIQCIMLLIGSCVWAYVIGSICGIISTLNPQLVEYQVTGAILGAWWYAFLREVPASWR